MRPSEYQEAGEMSSTSSTALAAAITAAARGCCFCCYRISCPYASYHTTEAKEASKGGQKNTASSHAADASSPYFRS
ncbi:uncharacterized protein P174DRAFT_4085 [Aspergillus novofumigatus IBT 16806]|uniref:Uncharacterized protein n=1 Tax=Aspergillus novofumigatus (strain IBT 16806) TaxID=1392255 RepID=A0A2I1CKE8_ASPN1|nr:uncharacterized protein P174DRAFT_4085 [Aspergillus novofumigatus IBT 16806]PKX98099.1 hypothetical protein P174DRAFT_4085 [Aspergillus novofumigatus IBT 16806]